MGATSWTRGSPVDEHNGKRVALRLLPPAELGPVDVGPYLDGHVDRVLALRHPNLVNVLAFEAMGGGATCSVAPFLDAHTLAARISAGMSVREAVDAAVQLASALHYLHAHGTHVVDLRPENVFCASTPDGVDRYLLADFALIPFLWALGGRFDAAATGAPLELGNAVYLAPEQARGLDPPPGSIARWPAVNHQLLAHLPALRWSPKWTVAASMLLAVAMFAAGVSWLAVAKQDGVARSVAGSNDETMAPSDALAERAEKQRPPRRVPSTQPGTQKRVVSPTPGAAYQQIDDLLAAGDVRRALARLRPQLDEHASHPELLWREGRALAAGRRTRSLALARFGEALSRAPALASRDDVRSHLHPLLRDVSLRGQAVDVALRHMGTAGHGFLLELVNEPKVNKALAYDERHRVLDRLRAHAVAGVDERTNLLVDLAQFSQASRPCAALERALAGIEADKSWKFDAPLRKLRIPSTARGDGDAARRCAQLEARVLFVRAELARARVASVPLNRTVGTVGAATSLPHRAGV